MRFLHFLRLGTWTVQLGAAAKLPGKATGWTVARVDYWGMGWGSSNTSVGANSTSVDIEVDSLPCSVFILAH